MAETTPDNLGEKYHPLQAKAHLNYWKGKALKSIGNLEEAKDHFSKSASEQGDFVDMAVSQHTEMSYFRALSLFELGEKKAAEKLLNEIKKHGSKMLSEEAKIDYFATSLPLLLVFEEDLDKRNKWEGKYLIALAEIGLGNIDHGKSILIEILQMNAMHFGAKDLLERISK